jgi:hypothetical protein
LIFSKHILNNYLPKLLFLSLLASTAFAYSGGTGEPSSPYQIANVNDLLVLAAAPADYNKCFILTADVNMQGQVFTTAIIAPDIVASNYIFDGNAFTGTFDGNNHSILNLIINATGKDYIGLFGQIGAGGIVKNLGIEDVNIIVILSRPGSYFAGGLCGYSYGGNISGCFSTGKVTGGYKTYEIGGLCGSIEQSNIINCYSTGKVTGSSYAYNIGGLCGSSFDSNISNCFSTGQVTGNYDYDVGGLCGGNAYGNISNCFSTGQVSGYYETGGLCGYSEQSNIINCYSTGQVTGKSEIGGLCGYNSGNVTNCYSTGNVSGSGWGIGGLCGYNVGPGDIKASITNCYSTGNVSGYDSTGGLCGYNHIGTISDCYSTGSVTGIGHTGGLCGESDIGNITDCYSTGNVSGEDYTGGLCGESEGNISDCYSTGAIVGDSNVGGLVGYNYGYGTTDASFWDVNTSGQTTSAGGTGKTTAQMKTLSTFTSAGWDFSYTDGEAVWYMPINEYPILTWQISDADIFTDGKNNFKDFAVLARYWMRDDCRRYNSYCDWADLNFDGSVDIDDLIEFMNYWLQSGIYE